VGKKLVLLKTKIEDSIFNKFGFEIEDFATADYRAD